MSDQILEGEVIEAKRGRPVDYRPEIHIEALKSAVLEATKGDKRALLTKSKLAKLIGVSRDTFYRWLKEYPEFEATFKEVWHDVEDSWVDFGVAGIAGNIPKFNATGYIYLTKVIHGWQTEDGKAGIGNTVNILIGDREIKKLDNDELREEIAKRMELLKKDE